MDSPAKSDSSGGRKPRNSRKLDSDLTRKSIIDKAGMDLPIGYLSLNKPSGIPSAPNWERVVCLDVANRNDKFSLHILTEIHHVNILHLEATLPDPMPKNSDKPSCVKICVENFTDTLYHYASRLVISATNDLDTLQKLFRQVAEGLNELRVNGLYHGNFNIRTTYFDGPTACVKLANFKEKGEKELVQAQLEDWHAAGIMVDEISNLQQLNDPTVDCFLLNDLAQQLRNLSLPVLNQAKDVALNHVFFWSKHKICSFFIYGIQAALHLPAFTARVKNLQIIPTDWTKHDHGGLLTAMNKYRKGLNLPDYTDERNQYVAFVSGAYTHEEELGLTLDVHNTIKQKCPRLCFELVKIVRELGFDV